MLKVYEYDELGDGPAKAVVAKTTRARQRRRAKEVTQELYKIKERVTRTLDAYDLSAETSITNVDRGEVERIANEYIRQQTTLEFVDDLMQLTVILSDPVAKRKYQQQVTVFIVGFENLCGRRQKLLGQLQEFFNQTGKEDVEVEPIGFDFEIISKEVKDVLDKAHETTARLVGMSEDVIKVIKLANPKESKKGKKKLEKALHQSQQDIVTLTEKLMKVQKDVGAGEDKLNQVYKSLEVKQAEISRLKIQAQNGKKNAEKVEELNAELLKKEDELGQAKTEISALQLSVAQLEDKRERDRERQKKVREENEKAKDRYNDNLRESQQNVEEIRLELQEKYDAQVTELTVQHQEEIQKLETKHKLEKSQATKELEIAKKKFAELKKEFLSQDPSKTPISAGVSPDISKWVSSEVSVLSPDSSEGELSSGKASLKSSANTIRMMLAKKSESSFTSQSTCSRAAKSFTPLSKAAPTPASRESSQGSAGRMKTQSRRETKLDSAKTEKRSSAVAAVTKTDEAVETERVEHVDVGVQSESEYSDPQSVVVSKKPSEKLETLSESKDVQTDEQQENVDWDAIPEDILMEKFKEFEDKALEIQDKLERKVLKWKDKYNKETTTLHQEMEQIAALRQSDKETFERQLHEAIQAKELAEDEAEDALLQLEEFFTEQEEQGIENEKEIPKFPVDSEEYKQTESRASTSRRSFISRQSSGKQASEPSLHGDSVILARDSGVDVASRPLSRASHVNVLLPSLEVDEPAPQSSSLPSKIEPVEPSEVKPKTLVPPRMKSAMSARTKTRLVNEALQGNSIAPETLRTYEAFTKFRDTVIQNLKEQGMMDEASRLQNIRTLQLSEGDRAQILESLPAIRENVSEILNQLGLIFSSKRLGKQLDTSGAAVTHTESVSVTVAQRPPEKHFPKKEVKQTANGTETSSSYVKLLKDYNDLAESYEKLRQHMDAETKFNQEQTSQNAAVMAEMQESISLLKSQLANARRSASSERQQSVIMFSRLDAERNSKILKRAVNEDRISEDSLSEVFTQMDNYISLPAKRLAYISRRYQHHCSMKQIEQNLIKSSSLNENVYQVLNRMEDLQNERAMRWGDRMDELTAEREKLAHLLTDKFDMLEQDTGIFLIKPILSYKGRGNDIGGYVVSKHKAPTTRPKANSKDPATPAPTPFLDRTSKSSIARATSSIPTVTELHNDVMPMDVTKAAHGAQGLAYQGQTWQIGRSQVQSISPTTFAAAVTTSRLEELDVNRMVMGQNLICSNVAPNESKADVLGTTSRSYVAIERPVGAKHLKKSKRPVTTGNLESPPNTPYDDKTAHRTSAAAIYFNPLPPIRMPEYRIESRSSKSIRSYSGSETTTLGGFRPGTQETTASKDSFLPQTPQSTRTTAAR